MNRRTGVAAIFLIVGLIFAVLAGVAYLQPPRAMAEIKDAKGDIIGQATFIQGSDGVHITVTVVGLFPGKHGIHIHADGKCDPPDFKSAGGHFNPEAKHHGLENPTGPHAGDLPNLEVGPDSTGILEYINSRVTLSAGATNSLLKVNGTSIVIHANPDDQMTDPAGNSGSRIACGVIVAVEPGLASIPAWLLVALAVISLVIGLAVAATVRKK